MKILITGLMLCLFTSCLMIGAPKTAVFKSRNIAADTVTLSAYELGTMYSYKAIRKPDSVFLFVTTDGKYKKMRFFNDKEYTYSQKESRENIKKVKELNEIYLKLYLKNTITYDTLDVSPDPGKLR